MKLQPVVTVKQLKAALSDLPEDAVCIYSKDDEGNGFDAVLYYPSEIDKGYFKKHLGNYPIEELKEKKFVCIN